MLGEWKEEHESEIARLISVNRESVPLDVLPHHRFPTELVDKKIKDDIQILRKSRFFSEFDTVGSSLTLGRRIEEGDLSGGTDAVRCRALAWIARLLSYANEIGTAERYVTLAKRLGTCPEIEIADAFIISQKGDKNAALRALACIDLPLSRSATLVVVAHHEGAQGALDWLRNAAIHPVHLDSEGRLFLLTRQLELARWNTARETLNTLTDQDLEESPVLHHVKAITLLLTTVPAEFRTVVFNQLPFATADFPLASNKAAMDTRRAAQTHFAHAATAARELNCPRAAVISDEYALWLELRDPQHSDNGKQRLQEKLRDEKSALRAVPLALQFEMDLDLAAIERQIEQQITRNGGPTVDTALARFALAHRQKSPQNVTNYVTRYYDEISKFIDQKALQFLQIEALAQAGSADKANEHLDILVQNGLSEAEERRLRRIISEAKGIDTIETRKIQFNDSGSLDDLAPLVHELERRKAWDDLCQYGALLFERTQSVKDAERLASALIKAHRANKLVELVNENPNLLAQSENLRMTYSWALYNQGELVEASRQLAKMSDNSENPNYCALRINLGIALGDWNSLYTLVASEYEQREKRNAQDLIRMAQLALRLGSPHARNLTFAAVRKAGDNADVLANAYFLASSAGWEDNEEIFQWLNTAAELSGDNGPLQKVSLKEVLDQKPEWDRQASQTWRLLSDGEIPMFLAAESLSKALIYLILFPALSNLSESDPRRRIAIPAYSGNRPPTQFNPAGMTVGMDASALLTLSFLNLLDKTFDAFKTIWVPHSTLAWLFEEKQKAAFHQPSRIKNARHIRNLLATGALEQFVPSVAVDRDLADQIGDELALLIAEAERIRDGDRTQYLVVRPSPVHRLSSLMEEEADLTEHTSVLCSCLSIVGVLRKKGQITTEEEKRARTYLHGREKPWPNQPVIQDSAVLYLDELAIAYLFHLGLLGKLKAAGFRPIASPKEISSTDALITYANISSNVMEVIERIRSAVSSGIYSGMIRVGRQKNVDVLEAQPILQHPTIGLFALAHNCDAIISDDRYVNQQQHIEDGGAQKPIVSTLDILDALAAADVISSDEQLELRTQLRRAGYFFIPVSDDELARHLITSEIKDNQVNETAELKAIRENILQVRMDDCLQLPKEVLWLHTTLKTFIRVLRGLWKENADLTSTAARSNWLVDQIDIRGWAHRFGPEQGENIVRIGWGTYILMLLPPPEDATEQVRDNYWDWLEERVLVPLKEEFPELYAQIIEWERSQIIELADMEPPGKQEST